MGPIGIRCMEQAGAATHRPALPTQALAVCCEKIEGAIFAARFTLRLASAVAGARAASDLPAYDNFLLEHALAALDPSQQVRFVFRRHGARADLTQVTFDVPGQAVATDAATAEASAMDLYDALTQPVERRLFPGKV